MHKENVFLTKCVGSLVRMHADCSDSRKILIIMIAESSFNYYGLSLGRYYNYVM